MDVDWGNLQPTSTPPVAVRVLGMVGSQVSEALGGAVAGVLSTLGSFLDLSSLDGVTVAVDYDAALAGVDRGIVDLPAPSRTDTAEMQGVAKTCRVIRDDGVRSHVVFNAAMLVPLIAGDAVAPRDVQEAIGLIAHECGHVQVSAKLEQVVPEARLGAVIDDWERCLTFRTALVLWEEYSVCRLTAPFAPFQGEQNADLVVDVARGARGRSNDRIRSYRTHGDLDRLVGEAGSELLHPLKAAAYLLGSMDGAGADWATYPDARASVVDGGHADLVDALHASCAKVWDTQDAWVAGQDVLGPIIDVVRETLASGGVEIVPEATGGWYVHVPLTAETLPV